jgi:hypothetical protein
MRALTYVELDLPYCANVYGEAPCTAAIGVTGDIRCFNSRQTCQDRDNYVEAPVTLRFAVDTNYLPTSIDCIPCIQSVDFTPATISLGESLGERATLTVALKDHPHSDVGPGFDKYVTERPYNPFKLGSLFGKFRARHPFVRGSAIRLIRGFVGQTLAQMETRHYVVESFDGPTPQGTFTLIAKDIIKFADDDRAQAPLLSNGFLVANINSSDTAFTLNPAGIGNHEYDASGFVNIGGNEICSFTRTGDAMTIVRAQRGTVASSHQAGDRVQTCLIFDGVDPADIIAELLEDYAGVDTSFIPLSTWQTETVSFLQRVYTTTIAEPTGVNKLISELVEQAALAVWWDEVAQRVRLQVLRQIATTAATHRIHPGRIWHRPHTHEKQNLQS